jgi:hypothetical protein
MKHFLNQTAGSLAEILDRAQSSQNYHGLETSVAVERRPTGSLLLEAIRLSDLPFYLYRSRKVASSVAVSIGSSIPRREEAILHIKAAGYNRSGARLCWGSSHPSLQEDQK